MKKILLTIFLFCFMVAAQATISDLDVKQIFQGNGSSTTFAIPADINANADLQVWERDESVTPAVETLKIEGTGSDYTITGGNPGTNVVFTIAPVSNSKILLVRVSAKTQAVDYIGSGAFPAETHEEALDKLTRIVQENDEALTRALLLRKTTGLVSLELPQPIANRVIGYNAAADGLTTFGTTAIATPIVNADVSNTADIAVSKLLTTASRALKSDSSGNLLAATLTAMALETLHKKPGFWNIGLQAATTSVTNDSIRFTSQTGAALSSTNVGYVTTDSLTPGQLTTFTITADITLDLTGAHWGAGTKGDLTDQKLVAYALNNNGSLVLGVGTLSQVRLILDADDSATATSVTTPASVLVNSALSSDAQALMLGYFLADFDDSGGSSEDLWVVANGGTPADGDIIMGHRDIPVVAYYNSNTGQDFANNTQEIVDYEDKINDSHNTVTVGASWLMTVPIAGTYDIKSGFAFVSNSGWAVTEELEIVIFTAGSATFERTISMQATATYSTTVATFGTVTLAKGDVIQARIRQTSGGTILANTAGVENYISIHLVGIN